jgi:hypothetical protein
MLLLAHAVGVELRNVGIVVRGIVHVSRSAFAVLSREECTKREEQH